MTTEQTAGALVREIRQYLGANVHLCGVEDSMLDDAALDLARLVLVNVGQPSQINGSERALLLEAATYLESDGGSMKGEDADQAAALLRQIAGGDHA